MARRKAELLDLLRQQQGGEIKKARNDSSSSSRVKPNPRPEAKPAEAKQRAKAERREAMPWPVVAKAPRRPAWYATLPLGWIFGALGLAGTVLLILWLGDGFGGGSEDSTGGGSEGARVGGTSSVGRPEEGGGGQSPNRNLSPPAPGGRYGIVAITYDYTPNNLKRAQETRKALAALFPNVLLVASPSERPKHYQIYVGEAARTRELESTLERLKRTALPWDSGRPFEGAYFQRLPTLVKNP